VAHVEDIVMSIVLNSEQTPLITADLGRYVTSRIASVVSLGEFKGPLLTIDVLGYSPAPNLIDVSLPGSSF